jgi:hypothetical protein
MRDLFPIHGRHEKLEKQTSDRRLATAPNKKGEKRNEEKKFGNFSTDTCGGDGDLGRFSGNIAG